MNNMVDMIKGYFTNSENGKLVKEKFNDVDGKRVSSVIKVLKKDVEEPIYLNKSFIYDDKGRLISVKISLEPDSTDNQPKKIFSKKNAKDANPVYEENELYSWDYDDQGRLVSSVTESETHSLVYIGDNEYTDNMISRTTLIDSTKTFIDDELVREVISNPMGYTTDISYRYPSEDTRSFIKKHFQNGKLVYKEDTTEKYSKLLNRWYTIDSRKTSIGNDIENLFIHIVDDRNDFKKWSFRDENEIEICTYTFRDNTIFYNDNIGILIGLFPVNNKDTVTEMYPVVSALGHVTQDTIPIDNIDLSTNLLSGGRRKTYTCNDYSVVSEFSRDNKLISTKYEQELIEAKAIYNAGSPIMFTLSAIDLTFTAVKQQENNRLGQIDQVSDKYQCRWEYITGENKYILDFYLDTKETCKLIDYLLEDCRILPEFNRFNK